MDDFGNLYQDMDWFLFQEQWLSSINTFGMFDDVAIDICIEFNIDYAAQDI